MNNLSFFHMAMSVHVLKTFSSKEYPMLLSDLQQKFGIISPEEATHNTTFEKKFRELVLLLNTTADSEDDLTTNLKNTFLSAFGGTIGIYKKGEYRIPGTTKKINREMYYFLPILDHGDVELLSGAVTTNPYLTEEEKQYLESRTKHLTGSEREYNKELRKSLGENAVNQANPGTNLTKNQEFDEDDYIALNDSRYGNDKENLISKRVLSVATALNRAIFEKKQVQIIYGSYGYDSTKLNHLKLIPGNTPYILEPYALCWNNGFYYLICRNTKYDNVTHFRVDRILKVKLLSKKRGALPVILKPYFKRSGHRMIFDALAYKNEHPLMSVHAKADPIKLQLETPALALICDYFGKNIKIEKTGKTHLNLNKTPLPIYKVTIENVEYSSALLFAQQQHEIVTVTSPKRLAQDVQAMLENSLRRIKNAAAPSSKKRLHVNQTNIKL